MLIDLRKNGSPLGLEFLHLESDAALRFITHARLHMENSLFDAKDMKTFQLTRKTFLNAARQLLK
jgi:hypothetical protein